MCLYPKLIRNKKYTITKKNKGIVPKIKDERIRYVPVGCGNCMECRKKKARDWQVRLHEEIRYQNKQPKETKLKAHFVNLTFNDKSLIKLERQNKLYKGYDLDNKVATDAVKKFLERWRKEKKKSVRHWLVTEIGGNYTERIHLHGIIWTNENKKFIEKKWKYGHIWFGDHVGEDTINYIVKYINKIDKKHPTYKSKILTSKGIGYNYKNRRDSKNNKYKKNTNETYTTKTGLKLALPIYYRNHIYTEEEREKLWIEKLDKKERWINGIKIDVSTEQGEKNYYNMLKEAQQKNIRLGYGDNKITWKQQQYENQLRQLKIDERKSKKKTRN